MLAGQLKGSLDYRNNNEETNIGFLTSILRAYEEYTIVNDPEWIF